MPSVAGNPLLLSNIWATGGESIYHGYGLVVFIVYGPNPSVYVGYYDVAEKNSKPEKKFSYPIIFFSKEGAHQMNWNL